MTDEAKDLYRQYHKQGLHDANDRISNREHPALIGLGAKMSAYLMRLTQVLAIMHNPDYPAITGEIMAFGYDLYRFYWQSTAEILMKSAKEVEGGLPAELERLYQALPIGKFTRQQAIDICKELGLHDRRFETAIRSKRFKELIKIHGGGVYERL
jgi:hypothetical protein